MGSEEKAENKAPRSPATQLCDGLEGPGELPAAHQTLGTRTSAVPPCSKPAEGGGHHGATAILRPPLLSPAIPSAHKHTASLQ